MPLRSKYASAYVVWPAALRSLLVAGAATAIALSLGLALATAALRWSVFDTLGMLALTASPVVIGAGLFLLLQGLADPATLALPVTALVNALLALPLVLRGLVPALRQAEADFGRLADHLGLSGLARLRYLILPRLRRPIGFAAGLVAALSTGDLGVITLFSDPGQATLPMLVYQLMGAYRMDQAAGVALLLAVLSLGLFAMCDRWGRHADAG